MIHPILQPVSSRPAGHSHRWHGPAALALLTTSLGALVGSTVSAFLESGGVEWAGRVPLLTPLMALVAATSVYGRYRHLTLDWLQARMARALVSTASAMMVAGVGLGEPGLTVIALWAMTGVTVVVTALAAGAGSSSEVVERSGSIRAGSKSPLT